VFYVPKFNIIQYPDPRLAVPGKAVPAVNDEIRAVVDDMFETLYAQDNCAALAATQLDMPTPWRITVIDFSESKDQPLCLINPEVVSGSGETNSQEGCMSIKDVYVNVPRYETVEVHALGLDGEKRVFKEDGFMAKCMQHEIDHLNGKLMLDHLGKTKRRIINRKFRRS
tara:strand:- start:856 stop:1362 length:507 start_codon:yes stop_codon:yes gene_type:complete